MPEIGQSTLPHSIAGKIIKRGVRVHGKCLALWVALSFLVLGAFTFDKSHAGDKTFTLGEVVAKHLASIAKPDILASIKSRTAYGIVSVRRPIGTIPVTLPEPGKRLDPSNFQIASAGNKLGMAMKFYDPKYPGEHFAFDGQSVTVSIIGNSLKSRLGEFIDHYSGIMREGLLCGTLSTAWPVLNVQGGNFSLKYAETKREGVKYHQITYTPKSRRYLDKIVIQVYLDFITYRHVVTEYRRMDLGGAAGSVWILEKFHDYRNADGMILPFSYSIEFPAWDPSHSYWTFEIRQLKHNEPIDPKLFIAK